MLEESLLFIGEPNGVILDGLRDSSVVPSEYVNGLAGTFVITDSPVYGEGNVVGTSHDLTFVADSNGDYLGIFPADEAALLIEGTTYYVWLDLPDVTLRRLERVAAYRGKV